MKIRPKAGQGGCCGGGQDNAACRPPEPAAVDVFRTDSVLTWKDRLAHLRCRAGSYRAKYAVAPGLYSLGSPGKDSEVFVSANYGMSFDKLRSSLSGVDAWILVLDTKGINVWCAAGKGTFGTDELVKRVFAAGLFNIVSHRRLIVPQLGAVGVAAHEVKRQTGFRVVYGPVEASDIGAFIKAGYKATEAMRRVGFGIKDRLVLTPMELRPALKALVIFAVVVMAVAGVTPSGISFAAARAHGLPLAALGLVSVVSGAVLTPLLLPWLPFRSFAMKGWIMGLLAVLAADGLMPGADGALLGVMKYLFFPLASSYIALQFTGSTVYTGTSGVQKELRYSIPVYIGGTVLSVLLLVALKMAQWGMI